MDVIIHFFSAIYSMRTRSYIRDNAFLQGGRRDMRYGALFSVLPRGNIDRTATSHAHIVYLSLSRSLVK